MKLLQPIVDVAGRVAEEFFENKQKAGEFVVEFQKAVLGLAATNDQVRGAIITAEAQGESWLQRNWRPTLMLAITSIVVNNHLLAPYVMLMFDVSIVVDLPERLWDLMVIGVGGYIGGRSVEKTVEAWANAKGTK